VNLYGRFKKDNKRILNNGFVTNVTITNPSGVSQTVEGSYIDAPMDVDPETGGFIRARRIAVHIHADDLTIGSPVTVQGYWQASFVNNAGETVSGVIERPDYDRTLGSLTFVVKAKKVVV
jgi:hypothetical protein